MKRELPPRPEGITEPEWKRVLEARKADVRREKARARWEAKQEAERKAWRDRMTGDTAGWREKVRRQQEEAAQRQEEYTAVRQAMHKLIDAGYRTMAKGMHPDTGGTNETMGRLTQARDRLRRAVT